MQKGCFVEMEMEEDSLLKRFFTILTLSLILLFGIFTSLSFAIPGDVINSFPSPSTISRPEGLIWDGTYLWNLSCEGSLCANENLYKIDPSDGSIVNSYTLPFFDPDGLTWAGSYLLVSAGMDTDKKIYKVDPSNGSWSVFLNTLPGIGDTDGGLAWDGNNLWLGRDLIYQIDITTGGIINSFNTPLGIIDGGMTWDGKYLVVSDVATDKIYYLNPLNGSVLYSFNSPGNGPKGLAWDGSYLWSTDHTARMIYQVESIPEPLVHSIIGSVTENGVGLSNVTMNLSGDASDTMLTATDGTYSFSNLSDGSYTITPSMSGYSFAPASRNVTVAGVDVAGQDISAAKTKYEENAPAITYTGTWSNYVCVSCSAGGAKISNTTGAKADFSFTGTGIKCLVAKGPMMGKVRVYLDGVNMGLVDLYSPTLKYQVILPKAGLPPGVNTVTLEVSGNKNTSSTGTYINIDAFDVVP